VINRVDGTPPAANQALPGQAPLYPRKN